MESITKRVIQGKTYYVKLKWLDTGTDLFDIQIISKEQPYSWSGRFSQDSAEKYMDKVDESHEEYKENVMKALTKHCDQFTYEFNSDPDDIISVKFSWKKNYEKPIVHGSVPVHLDDNRVTTADLIDTLIDNNNQLQDSIHAYNQKIEVLTADRRKCEEEIDKFINMKTALELSLYEKFVQLLNSKKKRIALLDGHVVSQSGVSVNQEYEDQ